MTSPALPAEHTGSRSANEVDAAEIASSGYGGVSQAGPIAQEAPQGESEAHGVGGAIVLFWREWLRPFLLLLTILLTIRSVIIDWNHVPTGSMKPSILEGDRILVQKLAYDLRVPFTLRRITSWGAPERGDVVVFLSPEDGKRLVKRVVAVAGDQVELRRNRLWINGEPAQYRRIDPPAAESISTGERIGYQVIGESIQGQDHHPIMTRRWFAGRSSFALRTIAEGEVFVMGDNRDDSSDSRVFGPVPTDRILGRATAIVASVDPEQRYLPRWDRFFLSLP